MKIIVLMSMNKALDCLALSQRVTELGIGILGLKRIDRVRNTMLRSITGIAEVGYKTAKLKWAVWTTLAGYIPGSRQI